MSVSINGFAWIDNNNDNIFNTGDTLFENVLVELYNLENLNTPIAITLTDSVGSYAFDNLNSDRTYLVKSIVPTSYELVTSNVGTDYSIQSHINPFTSYSREIVCCPGDTIQINLGFRTIENLQISGIAFFDCNNDSKFTSTDAQLPGVSIYLLDENSNEIASTVTGINSSLGYYEFNNLSSGTYTIKVTPPSELSLVLQNLDEFGSKPNPLTSEYTVVLDNSNITNVYIGFSGSVSAFSKYCSEASVLQNCMC